MNIIFAAEDLLFHQIHPDIFKHQLFGRRNFRGPSQIGLNPCHQLRNRKRLGNVVVGAGCQAFDFVFFLSFGGEHDDRNVFNVRLAADQLADFHAGNFGQHPVQQNNRRAVFFNFGQRFVAPGLQNDFVAFFFKVIFQQQAESFFIFDNHYQRCHNFSPEYILWRNCKAFVLKLP